MKHKILIVDDQPINRSILKKILVEQYEVAEAKNGLMAMEILRDPKETIDMVLLDLVMPEMNGYEVLNEIQNNSLLSEIPVIVTTQLEKGEGEEKVLLLGAKDYISKPYNPTVLLKRIENLIALKKSRELIQDIEKDSLTHLFTKEAFFNRVNAILSEKTDQKYVMVSTNIERFKVYNEMNGTEQGDELLKYVAGRLRKQIMLLNGVCGRFASDHFMFFLQADDLKDVEKKVRKVQDLLFPYLHEIHVSLKFGIYLVTEKITPEIMNDRARMAADSVKGNYDVNFAYYDDSLRQKLLREQQIVAEMENALKEEQFAVYFQPKYDLESECIAGAEALVRWIHPEYGFMRPDEFIPLFERNGFITKMDYYVWEKTCQAIAGWIKKEKKHVPVSVNVSRRDIYKEDLPKLFLNLVHKYGLEPKHLHLEITETAYTQDPHQLITVVNELRKYGFVIEMDDFGSGYSSLNMLSELPIDILKLDMKFIQQETAKNSSRDILSFIFSLTKWMKLAAVAEGVETEEQIDVLRNMDCDYVQGYYFAKPMPIEEFTSLLRNSIVVDNRGRINHTPLPQNMMSDKEWTMLIVDDVETNRVVLRECFQSDYRIVEAKDGREAMDYLQNHFDEVAVIMLDLLMPVMDGYEVLKRLKMNALYREIPVIVTSLVDSAGEETAFQLGAKEFLRKPYETTVAKHRVRNVTALMKVECLQRECDALLKMQKVALASRRDPLTGAYNSVELLERIQRSFSQNENKHRVLLLVSVNNSNELENTLGNNRRYELLQWLTEKLFQEFSFDDTICRVSESGFAVFMETDLSHKQLYLKLCRLNSELKFSWDDQIISCSIGACEIIGNNKDLGDLRRAAEYALCKAKEEPENSVYVCNELLEN